MTDAPEFMYVEWCGVVWRIRPSFDPGHGFPTTPWPPSKEAGWERMVDES